MAVLMRFLVLISDLARNLSLRKVVIGRMDGRCVLVLSLSISPPLCIWCTHIGIVEELLGGG